MAGPNTRDVKQQHIKNNNDQTLLLMQEEIEQSSEALGTLKKTVYDFRKDYDINVVEQRRDKKELEDALADNFKLITNLNGSINNLSETLRDPVTGLIVKLNETVRSTNETVNLLTTLDKTYKEDVKKLSDTNKDLLDRIKILETTLSTVKKYSNFIILTVLGLVIKLIWEYITKGV